MALLKSKLSGLLLIILLLGLWEALARAHLLATVTFPPFSRVFETLWGLTSTGQIVFLLLPSLERLAVGYLFALILGVALGMTMGYYRDAYNLFEPLTEVLRPIPSPAYVPIAILFLGLGDEMKIFVIGFASFFPNSSQHLQRGQGSRCHSNRHGADVRLERRRNAPESDYT